MDRWREGCWVSPVRERGGGDGRGTASRSATSSSYAADRVGVLESSHRAVQSKVDECMKQIEQLRSASVSPRGRASGVAAGRTTHTTSCPSSASPMRARGGLLLESQWRDVDELQREMATARASATLERTQREQAEEQIRLLKQRLNDAENAQHEVRTFGLEATAAIEVDNAVLRRELASLRGSQAPTARPAATCAVAHSISSPTNAHLHTQAQAQAPPQAAAARPAGSVRPAMPTLQLPVLPPPGLGGTDAETDGLIDVIKAALVEADKRGGAAETITSNLRRTEKKIAQLTAENERVSRKLERAVKRGEEYRKECVVLRRECEELEQQNMQEKVNLHKLMAQEKNATAAVEMERLVTEVERYRTMANQRQDEVRTAKDRIDDLTAEAASQSRQMQILMEKAARLEVTEERLRDVQAHAEQDHARHAVSPTRVPRLTEEVRSLAAAKESLTHTNSSLQATSDAQQREIQSLQRELQEVRTSTTVHTQSLEADVKRLRGEVDGKAMELLELKNRHQELVHTNLAEGRRENAMAMDIERFKGELQVQKQELGRRREEVDRLEAANQTLRTRVDDLNDKTRDQARCITDYEARLQQAKQAIVDAAKVHEENLRRLEAERDRELSLLKQNLQQIEYDLSKRKDQVEADNKSKVLLLEKDLALVRSESANYKELLAETTRQLEKSRDALDAVKMEAPRTAAAHAKEVDTLAAAHAKELAGVRAQLEEEKTGAKTAAEQWEGRLNRATEDHSLLKCEHARVVEQNRSLLATNTELKDELRQLTQVATERDLQLTTERSQRTQADTVNSSQTSQIADLAQQVQKKEAEVQELRTAVQKHVDAAAAVNKQRAELESALRDSEREAHREKTRWELGEKQRGTELGDVKGKLRKCEANLEEALRKMGAMEDVVDQQKKAYAEMLQERKEEHDTIIEPLREKVSRQRDDIHVLKEKTAVLEAQLDVQTERAQEATQEVSEGKIERATLQHAKVEAEGKVAELKETLSHITGEYEEKKKELGGALGQLEALKGEKEALEARLQDAASHAYDEQIAMTNSIEEACRRAEDTRMQLSAEIELCKQELADRTEEVAELREMNKVLKDTCARHEREAESMQKTLEFDRRSVASNASTFNKDDAQKWQSVSIELEAAQQNGKEMQQLVVKLNDTVAEEKRRSEALRQECAAKGEEVTSLHKQLLARGEESTTATNALKASLTSAVYLFATVVAKLHGFVSDIVSVGAATVDVSSIGEAAERAQQWRADTGAWDAEEAQVLSMRLLQCVSRCMEALKMHTGKASMNSPSPYTSIKSRG